MRASLKAIVLGLSLMAAGSAAHAAPGATPSKQAAAAIDEGYKLRVAGRHEEALTAFERAYQLEPSGKALAMMAATEQELARWLAAEEHAKAALASSDVYVRKNRQTLEALLSAIGKHIGNLTVEGGEGGSLSVDRGMAIELPLEEPLRLAEGRHALLVTRSGFFPWETEVDIVGGENHTVTAALLPKRPLPRLEEMTATSAAKPGSTQEPAPPAAHRKLGWGIAAGSAAVALLGTALWAADGEATGPNRVADTHGGPLLFTLGLAGVIAGGLLITGVF